VATRASLLHRLKDCDDQTSWQKFYELYRDLIYRFALKAGLTETEAEEALQETVIGVAKNLPAFKYDPTVCSFKTWLLNQTSWRIKDQLRKRGAAARVNISSDPSAPSLSDDTRRTGTIDRIADPLGNSLEALWEQDWQQTLVEAAMQRVKEQANLKDCQMYDLYVVRQWSPREVAKALGVSVARVYLAKHRIAPMFRKEFSQLEKTLV
jgi:RNA polymerase sigma-70 factor (ECF subfamily)